LFAPFLSRNVVPERADQPIRISLREQHGYHCEVAVRITMYQVSDHVVAFSVHPLLRRLVKVKLDELVSPTTDDDKAARLVIDLNRVAVVDDLQSCGLVM